MPKHELGALADGNALVGSIHVRGLPLRAPAGYARVPRDVHDALLFTMREQTELVMGMLALTASAGADVPSEGQRRPLRDNANRPAGARVLVVDDDPSHASLLCRRLTRAGFDEALIEQAHSGSDAIAAAGRHAFELAFVDWRMPDVDGLTTTRRLRRTAPDLLIVGCTSDCTRELRAAFVAAGADDCVAKPIAQPLMDALVLRWMTRDDRQ